MGRCGVNVARRCGALLVIALLAACAESSVLPNGADTGARPVLPSPVVTLLPTVAIAPAEGWPADRRPQVPNGLQVNALASGLSHPRWLAVLPNGDVLVAETNAPPRPEQARGIKGWVMKHVMRRAGAGVPSANRITLLRDVDGDGRAEVRSEFLAGLNSPFGMALVGDRLYVAHTDAVVEYAYTTGATRIDGPGRRLAELPAGTLNHHWTKNVVASPDGSRLYASVGSNSNVGENGLDVEDGRAAIWEIDRVSGAMRRFASGLRNPNGMAFTRDGLLWSVVNERDELGSDLVPDYLTLVKEGGFYGWPWSYWGRNVDERPAPRPDQVARALTPDYALGAHVAPLGLAAAGRGPLTALLNATARDSATAGMFVGLHGSWNRRPLAGYKVVFVRFAGERPQGDPVDVLTGFISPQGRAWGRPAGVAMDTRGALLVADDVGNTVWRVSAL
jgi:glucose/arabinose dehydrogenase